MAKKIYTNKCVTVFRHNAYIELDWHSQVVMELQEHLAISLIVQGICLFNNQKNLLNKGFINPKIPLSDQKILFESDIMLEKFIKSAGIDFGFRIANVFDPKIVDFDLELILGNSVVDSQIVRNFSNLNEAISWLIN